MPIDFSPERWERVRKTYDGWWAGELERPVLPVELTGRDPGRPEPAAPLLSQATCHDFSIPAEALVDRIDYELSTKMFLGDAYPRVNLDAFGPGILAAMLGARLDNSSGRVWFFPPDDRPIADYHFQYDPGNVWLCRIRDICRAAVDRWQGQVLVGMPDLGGNLDILASFRPPQLLGLDVFDHPDEVKRLVGEAHEAWHQVYGDLNEALQAEKFGYTDWAGIYSDVPCYMLQCDFAYMISPGMFEEFARQELVDTCAKLTRAFYHLDGAGQLAHLDSLLAIEDLHGVQWVPGAGNKACAFWPEVYQKIAAAGKKIQIIDGGLETVETIAKQVGTTRGLQHIGIQGTVDQEAALLSQLSAFGVA